MKCESCCCAEANVHLSHVVNEVARRINLCEECAAKHGINVQGSMPITDVLLSFGTLEEEYQASPKTCGVCRMQLSDLKRTSRLGCPSCYGTFKTEMGLMLASLQKGNHHIGKAPVSIEEDTDVASRIASLTDELEAAIATEDYEVAARLRDHISAEKRKE